MIYESVLAAVIALGAPKETAPSFAAAIAKYARTPTEAAFMAAWAEHESHFKARLIANDCKAYECDHGRAIGSWQLHRGAAGAEWDALPGNLDAQARAAARMTRWALRACGSPVGAFRRLGGLACDRPLRGEAKRLASFEKARSKIQ